MITANGFEEIEALAGRDLGTSDWRTVTQDLIDTFAEVSGDHQWIHTDPVRAAAGPFGRTIAHGYMTLSWGIPMLAELLHVTGVGMALNYGLNKVRFPAPVPVGSRVRLHASVLEVTPVPRDGVQMVRAFTFELEGSGKPACAAESVTRYYP
ncbi:MaoC family dehydratase [Amycolatopsis azurea]|uniref:Acyl dehydratase n=1 Tax=Amycolatopsis azurea DSM 43854 TaxID=1238180 RepID=M2PXU9_9PSEU|nr:MaoC family dehydratase [Amycolatopsis azurea]EMD24480.1 Acyl dehydratase [Amycolatopsis azurea DSM 43854]OOC01134.1 enoyl-CoA hydratase [Amycolatopsis azurea DSM 43854]